MGKALVITEKPSVARDVVDALGGFGPEQDGFWENDDFVVTYAVGHILELLEPEEIDAAYKRWTLATLPILPTEFKLKPKSGQSERIRVIKKLMNRKDVDTLINACDAGREGELIFRELVKYLECKKPIQRLWLQSMTTQAIRKGFGHLEDGAKYEGLGAAAECRSIADWLIGMNASRALTIRLRSRAMKGAWSAGRVQTPTLALLVDREWEILGFEPESYWRVTATFQASDHEYVGVWFDPDFKADESKPGLKADRIFDEAKANAIVAAVNGQAALASETRRPSREAAPPLFDLTSLQREANRKFGWSAARTLQVAQRLYESHKALTYPRTDSRCLPSDYVAEVDKTLSVLAMERPYAASAKQLIANGRQNDSKIFNDAGVSDHFAIIPTGVIPSLNGDDERLFDFVTRRFLSAFFPPAVWEQVERQTVVAGANFQSRARTLREPGWRAVLDQVAAEGEASLPPLLADQAKADNVPVKTLTVAGEADQTRPPPRITEARLLSLMENAGKQIEDEDLAAALHEKGLGTPATRADIIENLKGKQYIDRSLRPTVKGMRLIDLLHRINASRLTSAELTGELEMHLKQVEQGQRRPEDFVGEIIDYTKEVVDATRGFDYDKIYPNTTPLGVCPCDKKRQVYERAWFYRCEEDPNAAEGEDCPFRIWKDKSGRYIDPATVSHLLAHGETGELDGFLDRRGRPYKGRLVIEDKSIALKPVAGEGGAPDEAETTFAVNPEPLGPCPMPDCKECNVVETPTAFVCETRKKGMDAGESRPNGFVLPRLVCKREITRDDALAYLRDGETPLIDDFISRYGRPFKAKLKIDLKTGRHRFEFPPREPGKGRGRFGRKGAAKSDETETTEAAPEKKTAKGSKKGAGKKAAPKKSTPRKKKANVENVSG